MEETVQIQAKKVAAKFGRTYDEKADIEGRCLEVAWKISSKIINEKNPSGFIYRAMENCAIDYLRSKKSDELPLLNIDLEDKSELRMIENLETSEKWKIFIERIESPDKEILKFLYEGIEVSEISNKMNMSITAIRTRLSRGRKEWKKIYQNL